MSYRNSARLSELGDFFAPNATNRRSRVDGGVRSFIPRPSGQSSDRLSGIQPLENTGGFLAPHQSSSLRHRSADSSRVTQSLIRPRAESAQRPSSQSRPRSTYMMAKETPSQSKTPLARAILQTPMSAAVRQSNPLTPSAERYRGKLTCLGKAILALPGKDKRLIADSNWQKRTCERVIHYLLSHPVACDLMKPNISAPLRPITIKLFLDLTNCLLMLTNHVNTANYVHKLPITARKILYPGVISKSWLKSVNAMHTYPNMLAFLSYLVDFAMIKDSIAAKMEIEKMCIVENHHQSSFLRQILFLKCWEKYQDPNESFQPFIEEYFSDLKKDHGVSEEQVRALEDKKTELLNELGNPVFVEARSQELGLEEHAAKIEEKCRHLRQARSDIEKKLKQTQNHQNQLKISVDKVKEDTKRLGSEINQLQKNIEEQGMTVRQKEEIVIETENINASADSKRDLAEYYQKMGFEKDLELSNLQKQALIGSNNINRSLVLIGLASGDNLSKYTLEERDLLAGNAVEANIEKLNQIFQAIKDKGEKKLQAARHNRENGVCRKQQIKILLESERQRILTLKEEVCTLEEKSSQMKLLEAEKVAKLHSQAQGMRQRTVDRRKRIAQLSTEADADLQHWSQQDEKWRCKLEQMRNDEDLVRRTCEARAKALIAKYLSLANSLLE